MGGGAGVLPMPEIVAACESIGAGLQIIAVTGTNASLQDTLEKMQPQLTNCTLKTFGFVNNVHELMAMADLIISKPGGLTSAEALSMGLPLVIFKPIPGQEEANTRYLTSQSAAIRVDSIGSLQSEITALITNSTRLNDLRHKARGMGKAGAAAEIARDVLKCIKEKS
jgi:processive 1,2-diacylglycerol beta-glucosyltransferase